MISHGFWGKITGSLFLSGSRSRISSNCFSSSSNQTNLIQKPQIGCTPRLPHRKKETKQPEFMQSLHPSPHAQPWPLKNWWSLLPTKLPRCAFCYDSPTPKGSSQCLVIRSFIPIHAKAMLFHRNVFMFDLFLFRLSGFLTNKKELFLIWAKKISRFTHLSYRKSDGNSRGGVHNSLNLAKQPKQDPTSNQPSSSLKST